LIYGRVTVAKRPVNRLAPRLRDGKLLVKVITVEPDETVTPRRIARMV